MLERVVLSLKDTEYPFLVRTRSREYFKVWDMRMLLTAAHEFEVQW
jgi:hypothetical protein